MNEWIAYTGLTAIAVAMVSGIYIVFKPQPYETTVLERVVLQVEPQVIDWRIEALVEAHRRYGRPFKSGPEGFGEVLKLNPDTKRLEIKRAVERVRAVK